MAKVGIALFLTGLGILIAYGVYSMALAIYTENDVPLVLKVAYPVITGGLILLLSAVIRDRINARRRENFNEVKF